MIATSRAFMPDVPSLTCAFAGLYFFWRWLDTGQRSPSYGPWFAACVLIALGLLLKPTAATVAAPMVVLAWRKFGRGSLFRPSLWLFATLCLIPPALWYWHALNVARQFYPYHMFGAGGIRIMNLAWYGHILRLTFTTSLTPALFIAAIVGLFRSARTSMFHWWLAAVVISIVVIGYGNRHEWYRLPLVAIAATFAGAALSSKWVASARPSFLVIFVTMFFLASSAIQTRRYLAPTAEPLCRLARELRERTPPDALIIAADDGDPVVFYYAHRKGWHLLERDGIYNGNPSDDGDLISDLKSCAHEARHTLLSTERRLGGSIIIRSSPSIWRASPRL